MVICVVEYVVKFRYFLDGYFREFEREMVEFEGVIDDEVEEIVEIVGMEWGRGLIYFGGICCEVLCNVYGVESYDEVWICMVESFIGDMSRVWFWFERRVWVMMLIVIDVIYNVWLYIKCICLYDEICMFGVFFWCVVFVMFMSEVENWARFKYR